LIFQRALPLDTFGTMLTIHHHLLLLDLSQNEWIGRLYEVQIL
jgi:hypothetical protein